MELKGFREILLKKAEGNTTLQTLIAYAKDDILVDKVIEALEKMGRPSAAMGRKPNPALAHFAQNLKPKDVHMMRDALGHHISHYKAALKAAQDPGTDASKIANHRKVADQHMNKIIPLMHLAGRASVHSGGKLDFDYPEHIRAWEGNYTRPDVRNPNDGKEQEGAQGLNRRPKSTKRNPHHESQPEYAKLKAEGHKPHGVPDYRYLEMTPHPAHPEYANLPESGYPFEDIQMAPNMTDIDANKGYLHHGDVAAADKFTPHEFDHHPINEIADVKESSFLDNDPRLQRFATGMGNWVDSEHNKKWLARQKEEHAKDPEAYKARGTKKPEHVYKDIKLQESEPHVKHYKETNGVPEKTGAKKASSEGKASPKSNKVSEISEADLAKMPPALRAIYAKSKGK